MPPKHTPVRRRDNSRSRRSRDRVLCAVDFSAHSRRALRYAAAAAKQMDAALTVLFVEDPLLISAATVGYDEDALAKETDRQLRQFVRTSIGRAPDAETAYTVVMGKPALEIEKAAKRLGAALMVLGTQGQRGVRRLFLGSTTQQVLRTTTVPVLAIPPRVAAKPPADWPRRRVAAAVDLDEHTVTDARAAARFADRVGAKLTLAHVLSAVQAPPWMTMRAGPDSTLFEEAEALLKRVARGLGAGVETKVLVGNPAEEIASYAKRRFDLVILTLRRGKGLLGSRPGSITYELLTLASTPVLGIPGRSR